MHAWRLVVGGQCVSYVRVEHRVLEFLEAFRNRKSAELTPFVVRWDAMLPSAHDIQRAQVGSKTCEADGSRRLTEGIRSKHALGDRRRHPVRPLHCGAPEPAKDWVNASLEEQLVRFEHTVTKVERSLRDALTILPDTWVLLLDNFKS